LLTGVLAFMNSRGRPHHHIMLH